jgi:hypothetical protein
MSNGNLDFIEELGIGQEPNATDTEPKQEENIDQENDSTNESFVQDSETDSDTNENTSEDTDPKASEMEELRKMVEGMEKRIADKDEYIEKLRQESQAKETNNEAPEDVVDDEEDFWDNPVEKFNELKQTIQIQQMQIQETI